MCGACWRFSDQGDVDEECEREADAVESRSEVGRGGGDTNVKGEE